MRDGDSFCREAAEEPSSAGGPIAAAVSCKLARPCPENGGAPRVMMGRGIARTCEQLQIPFRQLDRVSKAKACIRPRRS